VRLKQVLESFADSFGDFAGAFGSANANVLARTYSALADGGSGVDWVQGDKVACSLCGALP
jgi:hypothetical protein